jgi:Cu/Ag efflux protein CusF
MMKSFAFAALLTAMSLAAFAQGPAKAQGDKTVTKQREVTAVMTITAIDPATRSITLRSEKGDEDTFTAGPEVTRFNQLKVGDKIRATYYESLVFQLRKPGAPSAPNVGVVAGGRIPEAPGGAMGAQQTMTVTVKAVDMNLPSITVTTPDGRTVTRRVGEKKNLEGVNPGDRIDITYTQALVVKAEAAK